MDFHANCGINNLVDANFSDSKIETVKKLMQKFTWGKNQ